MPNKENENATPISSDALSSKANTNVSAPVSLGLESATKKASGEHVSNNSLQRQKLAMDMTTTVTAISMKAVIAQMDNHRNVLMETKT